MDGRPTSKSMNHRRSKTCTTPSKTLSTSITIISIASSFRGPIEAVAARCSMTMTVESYPKNSETCSPCRRIDTSSTSLTGEMSGSLKSRQAGNVLTNPPKGPSTQESKTRPVKNSCNTPNWRMIFSPYRCSFVLLTAVRLQPGGRHLSAGVHRPIEVAASSFQPR